MRRFGIVFLSLILAVLVLAVAGVLVFTRTDYGREKIRRFAVATLSEQVNGLVRIGRIEGNLLTGATLHDISITDSAGAPFIVAERVRARYAIGDFLKKRVTLDGVELVRPLIVLDRPPGGEWNFVRLFSKETQDTSSALGWGDWVALTDVTIVDGRVIVRTPWEPSGELGLDEREQAVKDALSGAERVHVIQVASGLQKEQDFRDINAKLPLLRIADPEEKTKRIEVASLSTVALPFNPPAAEVRNLKGAFELTGDSLWWADDLRAELPNSVISGAGKYIFEHGDMMLRLRGAPVTTADLRWLFPQLPADGAGTLAFEMDWVGDTQRYVARDADIRVETTKLAGNFGITLSDTVFFHDTNLRFSNLTTALIERIVPAVTFPRKGALGGRAALAGGLDALDVNADVTFDDISSGRSRVVANGEVGMRSSFRAERLRLDLLPVQVDLVRIFAKDFPLGGIVRGNVVMNGSSRSWIASNADLTHEQANERSHVLGRGEFRLGRAPWMDVNVQASPVSLVTVGRFAPAIGLRGEAAGPIRMTGPFSALAVTSDLLVSGGGGLAIRGTLDVASEQIGYDLAAVANLFNANVVIARLPQTSLTATASARGRGFDPATMQGEFTVDAATSQFDSLAVDSLKVRVAIADGLASIDTLILRAPSSSADAKGSFGMIGTRTGSLVYRIALDSLAAFSRWLPARDTGVVAPRPLRTAELLAKARADSAALAKATAVERAVVGGPPPMLAKVDTAVAIKRDSLAGSIYAAGTLAGNVTSFDARGRAAIEGLVYGGNAVQRARVEYAVLERTGDDNTAIVTAFHLDSARAAGFALDSVDGRFAFRGQEGDFAVVINQKGNHQYSAAADFTFHDEHREVHLNQFALQFDTAQWVSPRPGTIRWGRRGVELETVELRNGTTGRIYLNGVLPSEGGANLDVEISNFEVGNLIALLQSDLDMRGSISLAGGITGTTSKPRFDMAFGVANGRFRGTDLPLLHGVALYGDEKLTARAQASREGGRPVMTAEGTMPLDLSSAGSGNRLPDGPMSVDVVLDSLPLEYIPRLTDAITDIRGYAVGRMAARGTVRAPRLAGALNVIEAQGHIAPLGITLRRVAGALRMAGDSIVIDSLAGSSGGRIRVSGGIGVAKLTEPSFDLTLVADRATVLDNERGSARASAEITMVGPFTEPYVSGRATVLDGVFYIPESDNKQVIGPGDPTLFAVVDTSVVAARELFPGQSPLLANLRMDVDLIVNRDTWVRSKDANIEIFSDGDLVIHVDRAKQAFALEGVLSTERGQYTFLSRRFEIRRGSATFIGGESGLNPTLQVMGENEVRLPAAEAFSIRVLIGGTLENPTISLESDAQPPLTQSDLLSYLAFGKSSSSLLQLGGSSVSGAGAGGGLQGVTMFAGQQLVGIALGVGVDELEGEAARSFGLDVLNITPSDTYTEVARGNLLKYIQLTEFEAGRYFGTSTFAALKSRLSAQTPGLRFEHRMWTDYRVEASFEPRNPLRFPSLSDPDDAKLRSFGVFGLFLIRDWRF